MATFSPPLANSPDVFDGLVVARYAHRISLEGPFYFTPSEFGPFNCSNTYRYGADYCYGFNSPILATLLTTYRDVWRSQLSDFAAPAVELSSPASYTSAFHCFRNRRPIPDGWVDFVAAVLRHRSDITCEVAELQDNVSKALNLEWGMIRKLSNEVLAVEENWQVLSDEVVAHEEANPQTYFTKANKWISGFVFMVTPWRRLPPIAELQAFAKAFAASNASTALPIIHITESSLVAPCETSVVVTSEPCDNVSSRPCINTTSVPIITTVSQTSDVPNPASIVGATAPTTTPSAPPRKPYFDSGRHMPSSSPLLSFSIPADSGDQVASTSSSDSDLSSSSSSTKQSFSSSTQSFSSSYRTSATSNSSKATIDTCFSADAPFSDHATLFRPCYSSSPLPVPFKPSVMNLSAGTPSSSTSSTCTQLFPRHVLGSAPSRPSFNRGIKKAPTRSWDDVLTGWIPVSNMTAAESAGQAQYDIMHS
ncbi:hypothetical protein P7C70_g5775, partial [Phenoliferia sp. Uapishka_3]